MRAKTQISQAVEDVELTISITMPINEWRDVMRQQTTYYPSWKLGALIAESIGDVTTATDRLVLPAERVV